MIQNNIQQMVGQKLKKFISNSKFKTQEKFAEAVNNDVRTVRRWIHLGIDKLNIIIYVAEILGIDFREFFN